MDTSRPPHFDGTNFPYYKALLCTTNVREQKHCLAKQNYDSFKMNDDELVRDMYSHLNLIINELHSIGLTKLDDVEIVRKIISVLP